MTHSFSSSSSYNLTTSTDSRSDSTPQTPTYTNYRIIAFLGKGAYGRVFSAWKVASPRKYSYVALKRISCESFRQASASLQEILKVAPLVSQSQSHLVQYYDCWLEESHDGWDNRGTCFVVLEMEYCEGGTVEEMIGKYVTGAREGYEVDLENGSDDEPQHHVPDAQPSRIPQRLVIQFLLHISHALRELHAVNIVHRDIKPENIFLKMRPPPCADISTHFQDGSQTPLSYTTDDYSPFSSSDDQTASMHTAFSFFTAANDQFETALPPIPQAPATPSDYEHASFDFKLGDFGLAKNLNVSLANSMAGSMQYMAPEVINSSQLQSTYDTSVDMWAVGCILVEMLTLRRNTVFFMQVLQDRLGFLQQVQQEVVERGYDSLLLEIIEQCLSLDSNARISAAELHERATFMKAQQDFFHALKALPKDVFFDIASFLPLRDLVSLSLVDHNFHDIATASHLWEHQYVVHNHIDAETQKEFTLEYYSQIIGFEFDSWRHLFAHRKMVEQELLGSEGNPSLHAQLEKAAHEVKEKKALICCAFGKQLFIASGKASSDSTKRLLIQAALVFCLEIFSIALRLHPSSILAWRNKGLTYIKLGKDKEALSCFLEALKISPNEPQLLFSYASFYGRYLETHASEYLSSMDELKTMEQRFEDVDQHFARSLELNNVPIVLIERAKTSGRFGNFLNECLHDVLGKFAQDGEESKDEGNGSHHAHNQKVEGHEHSKDDDCSHQHHEGCSTHKNCSDHKNAIPFTPQNVIYLFGHMLLHLNRSSALLNQAIETSFDPIMLTCVRILSSNALDCLKMVHEMHFLTQHEPSILHEEDLCTLPTSSNPEDSTTQQSSFSDLYCKYFNELMDAVESSQLLDLRGGIALDVYTVFCEGIIIEMTRTKTEDPARCKRICLRSIETLSSFVDHLTPGEQAHEFIISTLGISYLNLISVLAADAHGETEHLVKQEIAVYEADAVKALNRSSVKHVKLYNIACLYSIVGKYDECKERLLDSLACGQFSVEQLQQDEDLRNVREHCDWFGELLEVLKEG